MKLPVARRSSWSHAPSLAAAALLASCLSAGAATIELERVSGGTEIAGQLNVELGDRIELRVVLESDAEEELTGFAFFVSYDQDVFGLVPATRDGDEVLAFEPGPYLDGIVLLNQVEDVDGEGFLSYAEAASVQRRTATGSGIAATFALEVVRRPLGDLAVIAVEQRGHDRVSHYITEDAPGTEKSFATPLGSLAVRVTGFRTLPLPDVTVVEGEPTTVFDLDDFVDQEGADVLWSNRLRSELSTEIDPQTNAVTMTAQQGAFGQQGTREPTLSMVFTAFEMVEGLTVSDTIRVEVLARPKTEDVPATVTFNEDGVNRNLDLDAFVEDLDDQPQELSWFAVGGSNVVVEVDESSHVATFSAAPNWFGDEEIQLVVRDGRGLADTAVTLVVVIPVNDPPTSSRNAPVYPIVGGDAVRVPLSELIADVDDDLDLIALDLEVEGGITAEPGGGDLVIAGIEAGRGIVRLTATDPSGAAVLARQVVVALAPGESVRPEIQMLPELRFVNGNVGTLDLNPLALDDEPSAALQWSPGASDSLNPTVRDGVLIVSASADFTGATGLQLSVEDSDGNTDTATLTVTVLASDGDLGPRITPPGVVGVVAGGDETLLVLDNIVGVGAVAALTEPGSLALAAFDPDGHSDAATIPVLVVSPGAAPALAEIASVVLDSTAAEVRIDLDAFVFDDLDFESELFWTVELEPGVEAELDPVSHGLRISRAPEVDGVAPPPLSRMKLQVRDTDGQISTTIIAVELPPVFRLTPIATIEFFTGDGDTSLVLDDHVVTNASEGVTWSLGAEPQNLLVEIDEASSRVIVSAREPGFVGSETVVFLATDATGRSRPATAITTVKTRGLAPQIREFTRLEIPAGESDGLDLDDFVVDDDPDSVLLWTFSASADLLVEHDQLTNEVTISADAVGSGLQKVQFVVLDPAGNTAVEILEVLIVRGGLAPRINPLPQFLLPTGSAGEQKISLDLYIVDEDTPLEEIIWSVSAEPGISARVENRELFISAPAGQEGVRRLTLRATDPQGNQVQAELTVVLQGDNEAPRFSVQVRRNSVIGDLLELVIRACSKSRFGSGGFSLRGDGPGGCTQV